MNEIQWDCDKCGTAVEAGDGCVGVDPNRALERMAERSERTDIASTLTEVLMGPEPARWQTFHTACHPYPEGPGYWLEVHQLRTFRQVLEVTARLMSKTWLPATDWDRVIERKAQGR